MCDKRTLWIHWYLQYFAHFQRSLHGHADSQIFIANLRQKKSSNFQNMHFVRVSCTFCQKIAQIVFSFSTCQIVRVGWGGGGDDNVPWTCTHVWCYANWWLRDVNIPWTCTHVWCYANWFLRDVYIPWTCTHVWCYAKWWLRDANILWTCIHVDATQMCTHVWCYANVHTWLNYANWFLRGVNIPWTCTHVDATQMCTHVWTTQIGFFGMLTFLELAHMFDATQLCTHAWCYANVHTCLNYANWFLRDVNIPWTCTHVWCYATVHTCLMLRKCAHMFELRKLVSSGC